MARGILYSGFKTVYIMRATEDRDGAPLEIMASFDLVMRKEELSRWHAGWALCKIP